MAIIFSGLAHATVLIGALIVGKVVLIADSSLHQQVSENR